MNQLVPLSWIIRKTHDAGSEGITYEDLEACWRRDFPNEKFYRRTFDRRRDAIREIYGISIDHIGHGRYAITTSKENTEMAMWLLSSYQFMEILSCRPELRQRVLFEEVPHSIEDIVPILEAIRANKKVHFDYNKAYEEMETREVAPLGLYLFQRLWYLVGMKDKGEKRCYALNRITNLQATENGFDYPKDFDLKTYFKDAFGIFRPDNGKPEKLVVRFTGTAMKHVINKPIHRSQKLVEEGPDHIVFAYKVFITPDLVNFLMGFGCNAIVLEPTTLRKQMKETWSKAAERYEQFKDIESLKKRKP